MREVMPAFGQLIKNFGRKSDVSRLMELLQRRHLETYRHCVRVALLGEKLATAVGLDTLTKGNLIRGCFLHDLGKIVIPTVVLDKESPLTAEEWDVMKQHPEFGMELLELRTELDTVIGQVVLHHHERWDGNGYPHGLKADNIPLPARICSVIDAFDSMLSDRPYSPRKSLAEAVRELARNAGTQFDPDIVERFIRLTDEVKGMYKPPEDG